MPTTWRQCPTCLAWRDDVRRDHTGAREPCGACDPHEFGRCDCCGYKPRALKVPQEGGHDALSAFRARMWACDRLVTSGRT